MTGGVLIEAKDLRVAYGKRMPDVINGISFTLRAGERLAVIGPNGCGKTTLLRALAGALPYRGSLLVTVTDAESSRRGKRRERRKMGQREAARETGLLSQLSSGWFAYTVRETVMLGRYARGSRSPLASPGRADTEAIDRAMAECGVLELSDELLSRLSGGQLQRVFLARAIAQEPSTLLLDEPTNHLDLKYQHGLIALAERWTAGGDRATIGVFHDLPLALRFADRIILMDGGEIADYGYPRDVLNGKEIDRVYGMPVADSIRSLLQNL